MNSEQLYAEMLLRDQRTTSKTAVTATAKTVHHSKATAATEPFWQQQQHHHQQQQQNQIHINLNELRQCEKQINKISENKVAVIDTNMNKLNKSNYSNYKTNINETIPNIRRKFHIFVIVIFCISTILTRHTTMANPTTKQPNANKCLDVHESRKFLKECRNTNNEDITPQKVFEIVRVISVQSRQALSVAQYQIRKYLTDISNVKDFTFKPNGLWSKTHPDLHPHDKNFTLNKSITEAVPRSHLDMFRDGDLMDNLRRYLTDIYQRLQFAEYNVNVIKTNFCLQQPTRNNAEYSTKTEVFTELSSILQLILCEVRQAIDYFNFEATEIQMEQHKPIADLLLKSYVVYRDYINLLEYNNAIIDVFMERVGAQDRP